MTERSRIYDQSDTAGEQERPERQDLREGREEELAEEEQSLWLLVISPTVWAGHFLLSYITVAIWCAKVVGRDGMLGGARTAVIVYTALALVSIGVTAWRGFHQHSFGTATVPHDFDTPEDRHRFLGFATLLLSGLSAVGVIYVAFTIIFIETCR